MDPKDTLTNEALRQNFSSQFTLVSHAIGLAREMVLSGKEFTNPIEGLNPISHVLVRVGREDEAWGVDDDEDDGEVLDDSVDQEPVDS